MTSKLKFEAQGGLLPADAAPEHFRLYAAVQKEWFQPGSKRTSSRRFLWMFRLQSLIFPRYDIYARVCMLLGFSAFVQSLAFYGAWAEMGLPEKGEDVF